MRRGYTGALALVLAAAGAGAAAGDGANAPSAAAGDDAIVPVAAVLQPLASSSLILDVTRAGTRLVAVGERGHVLLSDDGQAWRQVAAPVDTLLTAVSFADATHGWAVGHDAVILHSADAGESWTIQQFDPARETPLLDVLFLDARRGYAVGAYGTYLATDDGGASWTEPEAAALRADELHLNAIVALGDGALLVVGESGLLALSADGLEYTRLGSPYVGSWFGALALGERGAAIFGLRGNAYTSDDVRSAAWTRIEGTGTTSLFGGARLGDARLALVGAGGTLLLVDPAGGGVTRHPTALSSAQSTALPLADALLLAGRSGLVRVAPPP